MPAPEPGTSPSTFVFAAEAGIPIVSAPVPAAPLIAPSTRMELPAVAARPPPAFKIATGRRFTPALSRLKTESATKVPPFKFNVAAVACAPNTALPLAVTKV